jgi:hypothetical protein
MQRARAVERHRKSAPGRGADSSAPRPAPLTLISGALAGDDLLSVAVSVSGALGRPVAVALPALGAPVVHPPESISSDQLNALTAHAAAVVRGESPEPPPMVAEAVAVRVGAEVMGIVVAAPGGQTMPPIPEQRAWLEAAAAAASVTALLREAQEPPADDARTGLLWELLSGRAPDGATFLARARRLGVELASGAAGICAAPSPAGNGAVGAELAAEHGALLADAPGHRLLGLVPTGESSALAEHLQSLGMTVAVSAPRRDPASLAEALREADLLLELSETPEAQLAGHDETYRLLIGVLLRDFDELAQLRARTITPLVEYDARHDTDLIATLQAFLRHDGSTTETAEAMDLHRHTVGYRLSRVYEVGRLSPYESDGRERLSLGLKADQIIRAAERRGIVRGDGPAS